MKIIGLDFEAAPNKEYKNRCSENNTNINSWNVHYNAVIEVGLYSLTTKCILREIIKNNVELTDWNRNNTKHINESKLENAKDKCDVLNEINFFLEKECKNNCNVVTYGCNDYIWLMKMYKDKNIILIL